MTTRKNVFASGRFGVKNARGSRYILTFFWNFGRFEPKLRPKKKREATGAFFRVVIKNTPARFHYPTLVEGRRKSDFREIK